MFNSKKEIIINEIRNSNDEDYLINMINSKECDNDILNAVMDSLDKAFGKFDTEKVLKELIKKDLDKSILKRLKYYSHYLDFEVLFKTVESKNADEEILEAAVKQFDYNVVVGKFSSKIIKEIITKTNNQDLVKELIGYFHYKDQFEVILNEYPNLNDEILRKIFKIIKKDLSGSTYYNEFCDNAPIVERIIKSLNEPDLINELINSVHKESQVKSLLSFSDFSNDNLVEIIDKIKNIYDDIDEKNKNGEIILGKFYENEIYNTIIDKATDVNVIKKVLSVTDKKEVLDSIVKNEHTTEDMLEEVVNKTNDITVMRDIINSGHASSKTIEKVIDKIEKIDKEIKETPVFNIEQEDSATERLRLNVEDGASTMLWGKSGIGKTARVKQVDPTYTEIRLKNGMLPEEVVGGKEPNGEPGEMYPPQWYTTLCKKCEAEPDRMHVLLIDEITNVRDNVKSLVWDIIEARRVNGNENWELPDNCAIVAAGNRPEESTAVITDYNGGVMPEPLHRRFDYHIEIEFDIKEWQKWALETNNKTGFLNIHPVVLSFCAGNSDRVMFSNLNDDVTQPIHDPRRWEKLSRAIFMAEKRGGPNNHVSNRRIEECIGKQLAPAFIAHYEKEPLNMKKVKRGEYTENDFKNIDDKLYALSSCLTDKSIDEMLIEDFIGTCLGEEYVAIYQAMKEKNKEINDKNSASEKIK